MIVSVMYTGSYLAFSLLPQIRALCVISDDQFLTGGYDKMFPTLCLLIFFFSISFHPSRMKLWQRVPSTNQFGVERIFVGHNGDIFGICYISPNEEYPHGAVVTGAGDRAVLYF
jgi:hypothetical protein